jgi:hypothetical protein
MKDRSLTATTCSERRFNGALGRRTIIWHAPPYRIRACTVGDAPGSIRRQPRAHSRFKQFSITGSHGRDRWLTVAAIMLVVQKTSKSANVRCRAPPGFGVRRSQPRERADGHRHCQRGAQAFQTFASSIHRVICKPTGCGRWLLRRRSSYQSHTRRRNSLRRSPSCLRSPKKSKSGRFVRKVNGSDNIENDLLDT